MRWCSAAKVLGAVFLISLWTGVSTAQTSFVTFESGQVRPIALSPDGNSLFAVNTPDNRLEIFSVGAGGLLHTGSVPVGMEPVSVAARTNTEVWVVNHLSDSISIVDLSGTPQVIRTLLTGDEPRDIVFAGTGGNRAFITTAHRGQHRTHSSISAVAGAGDPEFLDEGIGRADVWVFDATSLGTTIGGTPLKIIELFGDTPRALAVGDGGDTVYAAVFNSGNQTTVVGEEVVCNGFGLSACSGDGITSPGGLAGGNLPGGNPGPATDHDGVDAPEVGLIVKFNNATGKWEDELGRNWNNGVRFDLPDEDVFAIDADTLNETAVHTGVGTTLFNMIENPVSGKLYVSNTESINEVRFEGPGTFAGSTVQGHLAESRVTVIDVPGTTGSAVNVRHLNKHIDYNTLANDVGFDASARDHSLATPLGMAIDSLGQTLYVTAFGSAQVGVFSTNTLENNTFDPTTESANYLSVSGGGPSGLVLDETNNRLYVLTRFDNSVSVLSTTTGLEEAHLSLHNPEPDSVVEGRPFLYDAFETSANGEASCSSCHIFGDMDHLAWDLGNPDDEVTSNPIPINLAIGAGSEVNGGAGIAEFHPMKGPMTTQTLRGMVTSGAMHWRGDRANGFFGVSATDEELSFNNFIVAFEGLVGRATPISSGDMQKFTDFALQILLPPNPVANLDNSLTVDQQGGSDFYLGTRKSDGVNLPNLGFTCNGCHVLDASQGFFGSGERASFENETQIVKIPHLRNAYQKIGMFGMPNTPFIQSGNNAHLGDQIRGYGFLHDGAIDTLFRFFNATVFNNSGGVGFDGPSGGDVKRRQMEQFMLAFPTDLAPIVGQQVTLSATNSAAVGGRIDTMIARAGTAFVSVVLGGTVTECDLIVKGTVGGVPRGWVRESGGLFRDDLNNLIADAPLRALASSEGPLTYTCVPPGSGQRLGIDRDLDTLLDGHETDTGTFVSPTNTGSSPANADTDGDGFDDGVEVAAGSDPNDPFSVPGFQVPLVPFWGVPLLALLFAGAGAMLLRRRGIA